MNYLNENTFEEDNMSIEEKQLHSQKLSELNDETKGIHDWLNDNESKTEDSDLMPEIQPLNIRHVPSNIDAMIQGAQIRHDTTVGWLKPVDDGLVVSINVEVKLLHWLQEDGEIRLRIKKLDRPTEYNATHHCLVAGKAHTTPTIADAANKVLAVVRAKSCDDFEFSISPETIGPFIYRWKEKVWLKLFIKYKNNDVWVYGQ